MDGRARGRSSGARRGLRAVCSCSRASAQSFMSFSASFEAAGAEGGGEGVVGVSARQMALSRHRRRMGVHFLIVSSLYQIYV